MRAWSQLTWEHVAKHVGKSWYLPILYYTYHSLRATTVTVLSSNTANQSCYWPQERYKYPKLLWKANSQPVEADVINAKLICWWQRKRQWFYLLVNELKIQLSLIDFQKKLFQLWQTKAYLWRKANFKPVSLKHMMCHDQHWLCHLALSKALPLRLALINKFARALKCQIPFTYYGSKKRFNALQNVVVTNKLAIC